MYMGKSKLCFYAINKHVLYVKAIKLFFYTLLLHLLKCMFNNENCIFCATYTQIHAKHTFQMSVSNISP